MHKNGISGHSLGFVCFNSPLLVPSFLLGARWLVPDRNNLETVGYVFPGPSSDALGSTSGPLGWGL